MVAIELAYINTKHPDFADACGVLNNNIEVSTLQISLRSIFHFSGIGIKTSKKFSNYQIHQRKQAERGESSVI